MGWARTAARVKYSDGAPPAWRSVAGALSVLLLAGCVASSGPPGARGRSYGVEIPDLQEAVGRGEGRQALAHHEQRAASLGPRAAPLEVGKAQAAIAYLAWRLGKLQTALRAGRQGQEALRAASATEETVWRQATLASILGQTYGQLGDLDEAARQLGEGLDAASALRELDHALFWSAHFTRALADIALARGDPQQAVARAREAVTLLERQLVGLPTDYEGREAREQTRLSLGAALSLLGDAYRRLGRLGDAEAALARALDIARAHGAVEAEARVRASLGWTALARRDATGALARFGEALSAAERLGAVPILTSVHAGLGRSHALAGRPDEALAAFQRALVLVEDVRGGIQEVGLRSGFLDDKQTVYHGAVEAALALGRPDEAFALAERARARAFLDLLGTQSVLVKARVRELAADEGRLRGRLAQAEAAVQAAPAAERARAGAELEAARREYRSFLDRVRREHVEEASLMTVEPASLREVQGLLPPDATLVEYLVTETETLAFVVDAHRIHAVRLPVGRESLVAQVRAFRDAIDARAALADVAGHARRLHHALVAPVRPHVTGGSLLVVPHDVLHYQPFAALQDAEGRWLVDDLTLASLPSATVLRFLRGKGQGGAGAVAVGNPDLGPALALRWAEREARAVAERHPGAVLLVHGAATEARVKALAGGADLLHFATHAELDEREPLRSALLLAPDGPDDGRLEVREVLGLEIRARLVVLSGCETGLGKLSRGDELVGLQRAFIYAGAAAVVTTLWKVDDRASFALMDSFHARRGAAGPAAGLRAAQLAVRDEFPHPFFWAGYAFTGAPASASP